ncbi:hypothetical protein [Nostoc phage N1]|nr:hypothetical protein [Nostoc phage N1]
MSNIKFSEVEFLTVEELKTAFEKGSMTWCEPDIYIRGKINQNTVEEKKAELLFVEDGQQIVRVLEPIVFYKKDGVLHLLNGNNRLNAIFQMYANNKKYIFDNIPYKILEEFDLNTLEEFQIVSNDTTSAHSPLQVAVRMKGTYDRLMSEYTSADPKAHVNKIRSKVHEDLTNIYKKTPGNVRQLLLIADQPSFVHKLIEEGKISAATSVNVGKSIKRSSGEDVYLEAYDELLAMVGDEGKITDKTIHQWLENKAKEDPTVEVPKKPASKAKPKKHLQPVSIEEFETKINDSFNKFSVIDVIHVAEKPEVKPLLANVAKEGLKSLVNTFDIFDDESALLLIEDVRKLVLSRLGNLENFTKRAEIAGAEIAEVDVKLKGFNRAISKLYEALYGVPQVEETVITVADDENGVIAYVEADEDVTDDEE